MPKALKSIAPLLILTASVATLLGDDEQIAYQIEGGLKIQQEAGLLQDFDLKVRVEDGVVWMKGTVARPKQRFMVLDLASRVRGVKKVVNEIEVPAGQAEIPKVETIPVGLTQPVDEPAITSLPVDLATQSQRPSLQPVLVQAAPSAPVSAARQTPVPFAPARALVARRTGSGPRFVRNEGAPLPANIPGVDAAGVPARFDHPNVPGYSWPSYAAHPNYAALAYPQQYSAAAWPYIGPFYPYPQVPLGWRKVTLEWDDGWWFLDFQSK